VAAVADGELGLVLSGGGARASYQVGVLAAIAERRPDLSIPIISGVSAGAINTAFMAAYRGSLPGAIAALRGEWLRLTSDKVYHVPSYRMARWVARLATQFALGRMRGLGTVRGVLDMRPLSRFLGGMIDFSGIGANIRENKLKAVALTATSYTSGQAVTFVQCRPEMRMWERSLRVAVPSRLSLSHVMASSAIPLIFPAVKLAGAFYGDGSVRQTAPLSPAIHLGARRLLAISSRSTMQPVYKAEAADYPNTAQVLALLFNAIFVDSLDADAERLERINAILGVIPEGVSIPGGFQRIRLLMLRPSRDVGELTSGLRPRLPAAFDRVVQSMGTEARGAQEFLSYLLFDPEYTGLLMDLGYDDAKAQWDAIERFLSAE
jgi:NTE family protein